MSTDACPTFDRRFGTLQDDGAFRVAAHWQAGIRNIGSVGQILGLMFKGWAAQKRGYRKVMAGSLVATIIFISLFFFATNLSTLLAAEFLCGIPWGIFQTLTISYACEVAPVALRGYLTTWVNACWGFGQLISSGVLRALLARTDQWAWRLPIAIQWAWPVPLLTVNFLAPESPWWLVREGHFERAKDSLRRLTSHSSQGELNLDDTVQMMILTDEKEKQARIGTEYIDCFRGVELRRVEIVCMVWIVQNCCGSALMSYSSNVLEQAGLPGAPSYDFSMTRYAMNIAGTVAAWGLLALGISRRSLYLWGCILMGIVLIVIGTVSTINSIPASWMYAGLWLVWKVGYQCSVGTIAFSLATELPSRRLMVKSLNIGRAVYHVQGLVIVSLEPFMLNGDRTAWNWAGKTAFFWAGFNALCILWIYFRLPDPTGLSFGDIDKRFETRIPARKFMAVEVDEFEGERSQRESA